MAVGRAGRGRGRAAPTARRRCPITGFSIDTRTLAPGDVFVALKAERDGHDFVGDAFKAGAAAALVSKGYRRGKDDGALLRTADSLAALQAIGRAARVRSNARIVAVTGSAGKTGTKEMLRLCLSDAGATHASEKSYNNHWGVPLTLARMPQGNRVRRVRDRHEPRRRDHAAHRDGAAARGGDHHGGAGAPGVLPLGGGHRRGQGRDPARAWCPGGTAVLPRDNPHFDLLKERASAVGAKIMSFGYAKEADIVCIQANLEARGSSVIAGLGSQRFPYRVGAPGEHYVKNSLAVLAVLVALGADAMRRLAALARITAPAGRGARTLLDAPDGRILLIDESYNANPASVRAALAAMATTPRADFPRRVAVLGDMLELGDASADLHRGLKEAVDAAGVDLVLACGPMMRLLFDDAQTGQQGGWAPDSARACRAAARRRALRRRGDDQGLAGEQNGAAGGGAAGALRERWRIERAAPWRRMECCLSW